MDEGHKDVAIDTDKAFNFNRYHFAFNPSELEKYEFK
jgi:hypothetical protein